jgi:predicted nuclease of restriction endonuclease-like (RecB) superfamily
MVFKPLGAIASSRERHGPTDGSLSRCWQPRCVERRRKLPRNDPTDKALAASNCLRSGLRSRKRTRFSRAYCPKSLLARTSIPSRLEQRRLVPERRHKDFKADFIIANPPFNVSDWSGDLLRGDGRWTYGTPPSGNANFAWLQLFVFHLSPSGRAGVVLAKGALTSKTSGEGDLRKNMIQDGNLIDCIVNLPAKLFLNTQIPAALWFLNRDRSVSSGNGVHPRKGQILFIDARNLGHLINRRTNEHRAWIVSIKQRVQASRIKAAVAVNSELMELYWFVGEQILEKQQHAKWGDGFLKQMSKDLVAEFPDIKRFSYRNLRRMRQWYCFWTSPEAIGPQAVAKIGALQNPIVQQLVAQIPWGHNSVLLEKLDDPADALFYDQKTIENNGSHAVLTHQIDSGRHRREGNAINNFANTLPPASVYSVSLCFRIILGLVFPWK